MNAAVERTETVDETLRLTLELVAATYRTPDAALGADLAGGAFAAALAEVAHATGIAAPALADVGWTAIEVAHVALFVTNPRRVPAPPYVGFAADDELLGPTAEALGAFLRHHGVEVRAGWGDLPDHVAAVAEAGALLTNAGRTDAARVLAAAYLLPWFERYAPAVVAADDSGFYGPLSEFFRSVMSEVAREDAA